MTSKEYEIARLQSISKPCGILLMGRSGTGKTSVQCYRLSSDWVAYWRVAGLDHEPRLPVPAAASVAATGDVVRTTVCGGGESGDHALAHLRQIFVTKSMCLRGEVQRVARDLMAGARVPGCAPSEAGGLDGLEGLGATVPEARYPLFATQAELLALLDRTLPGRRFLSAAASGSEAKAELSGLEAYFDGDAGGDDGDGGFDFGGGGGDDDGGPSLNNGDVDGRMDVTEVEREASPRHEMTWTIFLSKVWRRLPKKDTAAVEAGLFWTEINSSLKGSVEALQVLARFPASGGSGTAVGAAAARLASLKECYSALGRKQSAISASQRDHIWALFLVYEKVRRAHHYYDQNDLVADLYRRLLEHGRGGVFFHKAIRAMRVLLTHALSSPLHPVILAFEKFV